jgi:hypothetical protein
MSVNQLLHIAYAVAVAIGSLNVLKIFLYETPLARSDVIIAVRYGDVAKLNILCNCLD